MNRSPLHYQITEYDCGIASVIKYIYIFMRGFSLISSGRKYYGGFIFHDQDFVPSDKG